MKGKLTLLPLPIHADSIGFADEHYIAALDTVDVIIAERIRTARRWLSQLKAKSKTIDDYYWIEMDKNNPESILSEVSSLWESNKHIAIMSESGTPCIADPGFRIVAKAHDTGITVNPLPGPNSIITGLMSSGLNGQQFTFHGYLPVKSDALVKRIKELNNEVSKHGYTQIFIETPYRNQRLFDTLTQHLSPHLRLCVAIELTSVDQQIKTMSIDQWKNNRIEIGKVNAVFLIGR